MDQREIETLVVKLSMVAAALKEQGARIAGAAEQAVQRMDQSANGLASAADRSAQRGAERLQETASRSISAGASVAVTDLLAQLGNGVKRLENSIGRLEQRATSADRVHVATAWKGFIGLALGGLAIAAAAGYFSWEVSQAAEQANQQVKWVGQINAAEQSGKLAPCADGAGLCALIGKKWVRLDQP